MPELPRDDRAAWEREVLDFLAWRANGMFANWSPASLPDLLRALTGSDWDGVVSANVLASGSFHTALERLQHVAPREVRLDRLRSEVVSRGRLRGRVMPRPTVRERQRRHDNTVWVTQRTSKLWQTEANEAVVGFLDHLQRRATFSDLPEVQDGGRLIRRLLAAEPLRHVTPSPDWTSYVMPPWVVADSEFYRTVWTWARQFLRARRTRNASTLRETLAGGWLTSQDDDRLFELYALSQVAVAVSEASDWDDFSIVHSESLSTSVAITAVKNDVSLEVTFDRTPRISGRYTTLLAHYAAVDGRGRRPDLIITTTRAGGSTATSFVEVKCTHPNSAYGRDSLVKVFGYLHDFAAVWQPSQLPVPKAVLLVGADVRPTVALATRIMNDEVLISSPVTFAGDIAAIVAGHLAAVRDEGSRSARGSATDVTLHRPRADIYFSRGRASSDIAQQLADLGWTSIAVFPNELPEAIATRIEQILRQSRYDAEGSSAR